jgi:putative oxidoreductase
MKIAALIARVLLGLVFVIFGLNGIHPFIPMGPMPTGVAGQFVGALMQAHYTLIVAIIQLVGGALLLSNRYLTLGLVLLGPVIVNIFLYHALMDPKGLPVALVVVLLWFVLAYHARRNLSGIFAPRIDA